MHITKQLAIFLDNRPGTLARLADALAEAEINIFAISTSDTIDHSVVRLVVSDYRKALHIFEERGALVVEDDVLVLASTPTFDPNKFARGISARDYRELTTDPDQPLPLTEILHEAAPLEGRHAAAPRWSRVPTVAPGAAAGAKRRPLRTTAGRGRRRGRREPGR